MTATADPPPRDIPERSYRKLRALRRSGKLAAPDAPCDICGTAWDAGRQPPRYGYFYTYDHCHAHDYVRGILCNTCNTAVMPLADAGVTYGTWQQQRAITPRRFEQAQEYRQRCPQCQPVSQPN